MRKQNKKFKQNFLNRVFFHQDFYQIYQLSLNQLCKRELDMNYLHAYLQLFLIFLFNYTIPFVIYDFKHFYSKTIRDRYPTFVNLLFQGINPIIFLVMISYQALFHINPKLLFMDGFFPDEWQLSILFYQHFTNWALMQLDYFLYEHQLISKGKISIFFCSYISIYFSIYGAYYYSTGKHVYGFQESMSLIKIIILNASQFSVLFLVDLINRNITQSKFFKLFILENYFQKYLETSKKKE